MENIFLTSETANVLHLLARDIPFERPRVAVITTALEPEDDADLLAQDRKAIERCTDWSTFEYTITGKDRRQLKADLQGVDIIYVDGGNVLYLAQEAHQSGLECVVREHLASGKIYVGRSAGAIIAGPNIDPAYRSDKVGAAPNLSSYDGLALINLVVLPHWGSPAKRQMYFSERLPRAYTEKYPILLITDSQYVRSDGRMHSVIDARITTDGHCDNHLV